MSSQMLIRINTDIKDRFAKLARIEGKSTSQKVRELMELYVNDRDIGTYVDTLWDRIGKDLKTNKQNMPDVQKAIQEARKPR